MKSNCEKIANSGREIGQIMGIKINSTSTDLVLARVKKFISDSVKFYIVTPNPELILASQTDVRLKKALNEADIAIPDGIGLKLAIPSLKIIKGRKLFSDLIKLSAQNHWKVFLLGGLGDEARLAAQKLKNLPEIDNRELKIEFDSGPKLNDNAEPVSEEDRKIEEDVIEKINRFAPKLLFLAFGNPKQEIWINNNLPGLNIGGAMAVGGAFRYAAGLSKLPPVWMEKLGLEWLWRGITEPKRLARIFRAVVIFPVSYFTYSCSKH